MNIDKLENQLENQKARDTVQAFIFYSGGIEKAKSNKSCFNHLTKRKMQLKKIIDRDNIMSEMLYDYQRSLKVKLK